MSLVTVKSQGGGPRGSAMIPPGTIMIWSGGAASYGNDGPPKGWLFCDGSAVLRELYPALFSAIGESYGAGDGVTTFNVPGSAGMYARGGGVGAQSQNSSSNFSSNHSHSDWSSSVNINHGNNGNGGGNHGHNGVSCSTDGHSAGHGYGVGCGGSANGGRTSGTTNYGIPDHGHGINIGGNATHDASAHNVAANTADAGHTHNAPSITNGTGNSTGSASGWEPLYIDMWHIIKT